MSLDKTIPPWTQEQVDALNHWQDSPYVHPFTCGPCRDNLGTGMWPDSPYQGPYNERKLVATAEGWICPTCDYTQNWAHSFMANPKSPFAGLHNDQNNSDTST